MANSILAAENVKASRRRLACIVCRRLGYGGGMRRREGLCFVLDDRRPQLRCNFAAHRKDYDQYRSLPAWAQETLKRHTKDERELAYDLETLETAKAHDALWNAVQTQPVREGKIHNDVRMCWGRGFSNGPGHRKKRPGLWFI
jgi:hypothetical protein